MQNSESQKLTQEYRSFVARFKTALLSCADKSGEPSLSYAPVVFSDGAYFVYLSDLAQHTQNLRANPRVALMFIEDERDSPQIFARTRVTLDCDAEIVERNDDSWHPIMDRFAHRFGEIMDTLSQLTDFHLFHLKPLRGQFVKGFAQAYRIGGPDLNQLTHIRSGQST